MMRLWTRWHPLFAGLALIVITNAIVLVGIAYNRSGKPAALLQLTDRELHAPGEWGFESENSGLALALAWRMASGEGDDVGRWGYGSRAAWLDRRKLAQLGFDVTVSADHPAAERHYERQLSREVLVAIELNGPAYQSALRRATERAARPNATADDARRLASERDSSSRLFLVDADLDYDALRARYPDTSRYAIVRGKVRVDRWSAKNRVRLEGYVSELSVSAINIPVELRGVLERNARGYTATVAFGRRLEPWFVSARKSGADPDSSPIR